MASTEKYITAIPQEKIQLSSQNKTVKKSKTDLEEPSQGTVLLRHPLPKYSFQTSKKNKHSGNTSKKQEIVTANVLPSVRNEDATAITTPQKPVHVVDPLHTQKLSPLGGGHLTTGSGNRGNQSAGLENHVTSSNQPISITNHNSLVTASQSSVVDGQFESLPFPDPSSPSQSNIYRGQEEEIDRLNAEVTDLKSQLDVQVKVNGELKKLLVASVGDDLHSRVEKLARDRAQMALELGDFTKKMMEDYENLDKVAIQADMWRSKYLASRVMADELASAKAFFAMQLQESQHAIQQLLNERHELRTNLLETSRCLQQVKSAFDPLNQQNSTSLPASNTVDLAKMIKHLSESIRYRLLPSTVPSLANINLYMEENYTKAESYAHELLSKKIDFNEIPQGPGSSVIERYHPLTNFENLTLNCCPHCKGEIHAL